MSTVEVPASYVLPDPAAGHHMYPGGLPLAAPQGMSPAMVSPVINPAYVKDSRWLTLEVCRDFMRDKCTRTEQHCKLAHPPPHMEVQNGRVTCCFDSIKGKCQRKDPPCKYLHPPQHLREQLLQNGRNNLILKNLQMQAMAQGLQPMIPSHMVPTMVACESPAGKVAAYQQAASQQQQAVSIAGHPQHYPAMMVYNMATHPYMQAMQSAAQYSPYMHGGMSIPQGVVQHIEPAISPTVSAASQVSSVVPTAPKVARADRLEHSSSPSACSDSGMTSPYGTSYADSLAPAMNVAPSQYSHMYFQPQVVEVLTSAGKKRAGDPTDDLILYGDNYTLNGSCWPHISASEGMSMPGMVPMMKRPAMDSKSGIPMYQPHSQSQAAAAHYQQAALAAMQLHQPFGGQVTIAGHPPSVPRF